MGGFQKLLFLLPLVFFVWFVGNSLERLSPSSVRLLLVAAGINAVTVWMLRHHRNSLIQIAHTPGFKHYLKVICRISGEQFPTGSARHDALQGLACQSQEEFDAAIAEAGLWIRGQPDAISTYIHRIRDAVLLRQQLQTHEDERPLLTVLLSGPTGIGKTYLARVIGRLILLGGTDQVWEIDKLGGDQVSTLFGTKGSPSSLLASLARQPVQTIVFENIEAANAPLQELLRSVMQQGVISNPATGRQVSFRNTILVLTTSQGTEALQRLSRQNLPENDRHTLAMDLFSSATRLSPALLACVNDFIAFEQPSDFVKAEVISLAMSRECGKYGVRLDYVAPELLVQEVEAITESAGFFIMEDRVKKLLQPALLEAARRKKYRLVLNAVPVE